MVEYELNNIEFSSIDLNLLVRGLFALQTLRPDEATKIQELLNRINNITFDLDV